MKALMLLALAVLSVTQAAEPTHTLKLACYGTASTGQWIDMNITIDFAARTVTAFGHTVNMSENKKEISFGGGKPSSKDGGGWSVRGDIDRVNNQLTATTTGLRKAGIGFGLARWEPSPPTSRTEQMFYSLQCRSAQ
jgi:hypothetical protein